MPRSSFPAAAAAEFKKQQGFLPIVLVDILLRDGTTYYLSDVPGTYTVKLGAGPTAVYSPWIVSAGPFTFSRDLQTDAGDLVLQNISGNSIERDMAKALKAHEFEGALCVVRYWHALLALSVMEFHGTLGGQRDLGDTCDFRFKQLMDANRLDALVDPLSEQCPWTFKTDPRCGSVGIRDRLREDLRRLQRRDAGCDRTSRWHSDRPAGVRECRLRSAGELWQRRQRGMG
jgi:hypothetical protein